MHILLKQNDVLVLENVRSRTVNAMAHATNVGNLSPFFFERLPIDRVKEQCPFFYSRTGDDTFFFLFFLKLTF